MSLATREIIDNVLSLPNAPQLVQQIRSALEDEQQRRQAFYNEITDAEKIEFINGQIIIHSPVKKEHNDASVNLCQLITTYVRKNKLGYVGFEKIMIALTRNDYEPDLCFFNNEKSAHFKKGQSLFPAPDLIVEVLSKGTEKHDRGVKFDDYQAHEVLEYWIIHPINQTVEQYRLNKPNGYELILKSQSGWLVSEAIKGFKIQIESIFDEELNMTELLRLLGA